MSVLKKHKLTLITIAFWFLLTYIIAALLWWFIALNTQNNVLIASKLSELNKDDVLYNQKLSQILDIEKRKKTQYLGEGVTFLVLILIGATVIYRTIRKQIKFAQQQQNFMMAITHELKTPIAIAQLNIETIQKRTLDNLTQNQLLQNSLTEINRLNTLSNNILWAAQLDAGKYKQQFNEFDMSQIISDCVNNFIQRVQSHKINCNIKEEIFVLGDQLMIEILINNLLDNAIKYSERNTEIVVNLIYENNKKILTVADNGIGILEQDKKKIFTKFYRLGNENTRKTKGTGLGLYLCKKIADYHKANILVQNNNLKGSIFKVIFN